MRAFEFGRCTLSVSLASALLCACGGSSIPIQAADRSIGAGASKGTKTFSYTGKEQTFIVPAGVKQLTVVAHGGEGGGFSAPPSSDTPGFPARVYAIIPVRPGDKLYVFVGGSGAHGGFNGGGAGGSGAHSYAGNPGGGASDVRSGGDALQDRIIVAAGGGGAGEDINYYGTAYGGDGGGLDGKSGGGGGSEYSGGGGAGGTQSQGGSGGAGGRGHPISGYGSYGNGQPGDGGSLGTGGSGGKGAGDYEVAGGGGGGGGYYGGGGGGGGGASYYYRYDVSQSGGGGGGSSYVEPSAIKSRMWAGWQKAQSRDGLVVFSWK